MYSTDWRSDSQLPRPRRPAHHRRSRTGDTGREARVRQPVDAGRVGRARFGASFGGVDFYPDLASKAAVLCIHLVKNHPFPDGNKRVAFLAMIEFVERNGHRWTPPPGDEDGEVSAQMIIDVAAGPVNDRVVDGLAQWIRECAAIME